MRRPGPPTLKGSTVHHLLAERLWPRAVIAAAALAGCCGSGLLRDHVLNQARYISARNSRSIGQPDAEPSTESLPHLGHSAALLTASPLTHLYRDGRKATASRLP
jgi:hypothetical protein